MIPAFREPEQLIAWIVQRHGRTLTQGGAPAAMRKAIGACRVAAKAKRVPVDEVIAHVKAEYEREGQTPQSGGRRGTKAENEERFKSACCGAQIVLGAGRQWWCTACFEDVAPPPTIDEFRARAGAS